MIWRYTLNFTDQTASATDASTKNVKKYCVEYMELYSLKRYGILICDKYTGANVSEVQATSIFRIEVLTKEGNGM